MLHGALTQDRAVAPLTRRFRPGRTRICFRLAEYDPPHPQ